MGRLPRNAAMAVLALLLARPFPADPAPAREPEGPNILLIVTDDQRADRASIAVMPRTRRWLEEGGTTFENAFVTTPYCCPSRASIFTGRYTHNHGITHNLSRNLDIDHRTTVQHHLRGAGYRTAYFGKFLNGWDVGRSPPHFDRWAIFSKVNTPENRAAGYSGGMWNVQGRVRRVEPYSTTFIRRRAVRFLRQAGREGHRPWFMVVAPAAPHPPAPPEPGYRDAEVPRFRPTPAMLEEDRSDKPPFFRGSDMRGPRVERMRRDQLRTLLSVDDMVEALFETMGRLGQRRDTLVLFTSDNGFLWGEHGRTRKLYPYTMSIKVPFMMRWPGRVEAGAHSDRIVANIDIAPTLLDAAGIEPPAWMDGRSMLGGGARDRILTELWAAAYAPEWASTRTRAFQYTEYYDDGGDVIFTEYYDLAADPWQLRNRARSLPPERRLELSTRLARDRQCAGTEGPTACP